MAQTWLTAALWVGLALIASWLSIRTAISVALVEIVVGALAGNLLHLHPTDWVNFLAGLGSVLLTFLAGAEIEPYALRKHWKPALVIGFVSFLAPFLGAMMFARFLLGWSANASKIAGIALSTTSVAVVYAVMVETGLNATDIGKLILAACFVTDLGTVLALGALFANYNGWLVAFLLVTTLVLLAAPCFVEAFLRRFEGQISEPEIKLLLLLLFGLGGLAAKANSEAVLPAYLLGLVTAGALARHRETMHHLRVATFALLTPFYFLKAGALVQASVVFRQLGIIALLLVVKMVAKLVGVYPLARIFRLDNRTAAYTTLLMSTGLTFGTISALFGLTRGYITAGQYSTLVTAVIASAIVPTLIAQSFFRPKVSGMEVLSEDEALAIQRQEGSDAP
jgi:Kef-type K+ transport system membrane component KefB